MVDGTGLENQHTKVSQVRILSLPPSLCKKISPEGLFLTTVFEARMFALVAVLVIIVAILLCNFLHCKFSCHAGIIPCLL